MTWPEQLEALEREVCGEDEGSGRNNPPGSPSRCSRSGLNFNSTDIQQVLNTHRDRDGAMKHYSDAELELYARYQEARASWRPAGCHQVADQAVPTGCWVAEGPPGLTGNGNSTSLCRACGETPCKLRVGRQRGARYR